MNYSVKIHKLGLSLTLVPLYCSLALAQNHGSVEKMSQQEEAAVENLIKADSTTDLLNPRQRILGISERLLGRPWVGGVCGEGKTGKADPDPMFCLDRFDCTTFVETVLASAFVKTRVGDPSIGELRCSDQFLYHYKEIKYCNSAGYRHSL
jgi:hypothetical protein